MSELSRSAKELVRAGRLATRPSPAARARVTQALRARLGEAALAGGAASPNGGLWTRGSLLWKGMAVAVICGLGAAGYWALRPGPEAARSTPIVQSVAASISGNSSESPEPKVDAEPSASAIEPKRKITDTRVQPSAGRRSESRAPDRLAEEVAILSRAEADLHRGQAALALRSLDEHQIKFPRGALTVERRAARARALCALGRVDEAKAELARLSRIAPGSSFEARVREACALGS